MRWKKFKLTRSVHVRALAHNQPPIHPLNNPRKLTGGREGQQGWWLCSSEIRDSRVWFLKRKRRARTKSESAPKLFCVCVCVYICLHRRTEIVVVVEGAWAKQRLLKVKPKLPHPTAPQKTGECYPSFLKNKPHILTRYTTNSGVLT